MLSISELKKLFRGSRTLVVTGAGLSNAAGIPDYISDGDYQGPSLFDMCMIPISRSAFNDLVKHNLPVFQRLAKAKPTKAHKAIDKFVRVNTFAGLASSLWTQNVDGLHRVIRNRVHEAHGSLLRRRRFLSGEVSKIPRSAFLRLGEQLTSGKTYKSLAELFRIYGVGLPDVVFMGQDIQVPSQVFDTAEEVHDVLLLAGTSGRIGWVQDLATRFNTTGKLVVHVANESYLTCPSLQYRKELQQFLPDILAD